MINIAVLVGRLTRDPELRYSPNGKPYCSFTLAVDRSFVNAEGEREADFIKVVAWNKTAENLEKYLVKGSLVGVTGRVRVRSYDKGDERRWITEIVANRVQFLDKRKELSENEESESEEIPF